jgi:cation diffusion facilitator family transporter
MNNHISFQKKIALVGLALFIIKMLAWTYTGSDAIFSDAMESIVNVLSAFIGLYALYLAAKPRDENHPYGHGKIEYISSGLEGGLIIFAGLMIIKESALHLYQAKILANLDSGMWLIVLTAAANYLTGHYAIKKGEAENSPVLISSGKHLQSDTYTTVGVVLSLFLVQLTQWLWLDSVVAVIFAVYIMVVGYKIIRKSIKGIMDEADIELLEETLQSLNAHRQSDWIDIHNVKIVQYGSMLHLDAHITMPWYYSLRQSNETLDQIYKVLKQQHQRHIDINLHVDDCKPDSCAICQLNCPERLQAFQQNFTWSVAHITKPRKHNVKDVEH